MDINENIKTICKIRGISFADLAARLNITRQTLYKQSTGAAQLSTVERIATALNVPAWIILHPAPAAALVQIRTGQVPGPEDRTSQGDTNQAGTIQAARLLCPICGSRLQIQIRQDEGRAPSNDPDQGSDGQNNTTKGQDQTRPDGQRPDGLTND